uniref:L1 transposable element RRM domain-containing protein n=1 Tax=Knipowitschia caucasica TaxID=637954 RepID=A0AAV2J4T9_KNICA
MRGGVKTRSRRKREPQQNGQKMAETEQGDGAENVSSMLRAIKTDLQEFRVENKNDFRNMKEELRNDMKAELALLKGEVYQSISENTEKANALEIKLAEAEARIAEAEKLNAAMKDALTKVMKNQMIVQSKLTDIEGRSRRNNIRIYGVKEGSESDSMLQFMDGLLKKTLSLPQDMNLRMQRAHRALTRKPEGDAPPRSIIINFQEYTLKEDILKRAWAQRIMHDGQRISFDHDYATDVVQKRREYGNIKRALKEKSVRFQTPLDKIRIHWDTGARTYGSAREAAIEMRRRGYVVPGPPETLEHLLVLCPAVRPFWTRVQDLLARRLAWRLPTPAALGGGDKKSWLLHFGPIGSRSGATTNIDLVRLITAMARYRVFIVRNICLHNRRTGLHWPTFTGLLTAHLRPPALCIGATVHQHSCPPQHPDPTHTIWTDTEPLTTLTMDPCHIP